MALHGEQGLPIGANGYGVGAGMPINSTNLTSRYRVELLNLKKHKGWYQDWGAFIEKPSKYRDYYFPMTYGNFKSKDVPWMTHHPYFQWSLSNEPNNRSQHGGNFITPEQAANNLRQYSQYTDNKFIGPGVVDIRYYNERVSNAKVWLAHYIYTLGTDVKHISAWNLHFYELSQDENGAIQEFKERLNDYRKFFAYLGVSKPIIVSETSAEIASPQIQADYMEALIAYQKVDPNVGICWFSTQYLKKNAMNSNMFTPGGNLTEIGEVYRDR